MNIYLFQRILGIGVLFLHLIIILLIGYLIYRKISKRSCLWIENTIASYGMVMAATTALLGIIGSLIFSDIYHIEPCKLCWLQRIALYPQALIMFIAAKAKDIKAWSYALWLSIIGLLIGLYQVNEQLNLSDLVPEAKCVSGIDAACAQIHMLEFGYITFPVGSASLFLFIILIYLIQKK